MLVRLYLRLFKRSFGFARNHLFAGFVEVAVESHFVNHFVVYFNLEPFRKRVGNGRAYPVQTARKTIVFVVEFTTRMKLREDYLNAGNTRLFMYIGRNTSSVILNRNASVFIKNDFYFIRKSVRGFVDRVIDDFPQNMV